MVDLRHTSKQRWTLRASVALIAAAACVCLLPAPSAEAARSITPPQWFSCGTYHAGMISIGPPRVWASLNRPEQVVWATSIQRWNGSVWVTYGQPYIFWSSFNYYGLSLTSWSVWNTTTGGRYVNSRLNLPVRHTGYYRVAAAINGNQGGQKWTGWLRGGASCYMP
jgi:hypothetical protein